MKANTKEPVKFKLIDVFLLFVIVVEDYARNVAARTIKTKNEAFDVVLQIVWWI